MTLVVSFEDYRPVPRYDGDAWTEVRVYEATSATGTFNLIDTIAISPVDADPENPAYRNFTTPNGTAEDLWYKLVFADVLGNTSVATPPVQNSTNDRPVYGDTAKLARLLRVSESDRHAELRLVLEAAAAEIDAEIGTVDVNGVSLPYGDPPALVTQVAYDRAVEHWKQSQAPFGILNLGDLADQVTQRTARDGWDRHAYKLASLKGSWGIA